MAGKRHGWAFGEFTGSRDWLTIPGSYYRRPELHQTRMAAEAAMSAHPLYGSAHAHLEVAHVTEVRHGGVSGGYAYRVTAPPVSGATPESRPASGPGAGN